MQANEAEICFDAPKSRKHLGLSVRKHQLHVPEARNSCVCMMSCEVDSSSADRKHEASSLHTAHCKPPLGSVFVSTASTAREGVRLQPWSLPQSLGDHH